MLETEKDVMDWIDQHLDSDLYDYLTLTLRTFTKVADFWIVSPPAGKRGASSLLIAEDGSFARATGGLSTLHVHIYDFAPGELATNKDLIWVYPPEKVPPKKDWKELDLRSEKNPPVGPDWQEKLAELKKERSHGMFKCSEFEDDLGLAAFSIDIQTNNPVLLLHEATGGILLNRGIDSRTVSVSWTTDQGNVRGPWALGEVHEIIGTPFRLVKLGTFSGLVGYAHFVRVSPPVNLTDLPENVRAVYKYESPPEKTSEERT